MDNIHRCAWVDNYPPNEAMRVYHDTEWGKPEYDDDKLFELLSLETYQTGLSWQPVIDKRERFNERFEGYVIDNVAQYDESYVEDLLQDAGIIRRRCNACNMSLVVSPNGYGNLLITRRLIIRLCIVGMCQPKMLCHNKYRRP